MASSGSTPAALHPYTDSPKAGHGTARGVSGEHNNYHPNRTTQQQAIQAQNSYFLTGHWLSGDSLLKKLPVIQIPAICHLFQYYKLPPITKILL